MNMKNKKNIKILLVWVLIIILASSFAAGCSQEKEIDADQIMGEEPADYYLNLYITRSPYGLNWESPSTLARSLLKNAVPSFLGTSSTMLGHTNYELKGAGEDPIYAGMSYHDQSEAIKLIFSDKTGLGLLFHNMGGRFDDFENINDARNGFLEGVTSIITFIIDEETYRQINNYVEAYLDKGEHLNYGLHNNPFLSASKGISREKIDKFPQNEDGIPLGAGCTAFAVSSLQELEIFDLEVYNQWYAEARAPEEFIGQYSDQTYSSGEELEELHPMNNFEGKEVSIWNIIFNAHSWADESEPGQDILYYCPDRIHEWVEKAANKYEVGSEVMSGRLTSIEEAPSPGSSYRLVIDLTK